MSYKAEITTSGDQGVYTSNALRFETEHEALQYAADLSSRWTAVVDSRIAESDDSVSHEWTEGRGLAKLGGVPRMPARRISL